MRTRAQEKLAAAIQDYLLDRTGSGYYFDQIPVVLANGSAARARVRIEIVPPVPEPDWGQP